MRTLDRVFDWETGPTIDVGVAPPGVSRGDSGHASVVWAKALIDTGCSHTSISERFAKRLSLPVCGRADIHGATGLVRDTEVWLADLFLAYDVPRSRHNHCLPDVPLVVYLAPRYEPDVLIGRDLLSVMEFRLDGPGRRFSLTLPP